MIMMFIDKSVLKCYIETKPLCINEHDEFNKIKMKNSNYSMRWFLKKGMILDKNVIHIIHGFRKSREPNIKHV